MVGLLQDANRAQAGQRAAYSYFSSSAWKRGCEWRPCTVLSEASSNILSIIIRASR